MKINRELFFKILDYVLVLVLASMSYFFVIEAWYDYKEERTNMSTGRIPIQEHPTMTVCVGPWNNRLTLGHTLKAEFYYYKIPPNLVSFTEVKWRKLYEGTNHFEDEEIVLKKMRGCYAIISRPKENYYHKPQEKRLIKVVLPNENEEIITYVKPDGSKWTLGELLWYFSFFVTFSTEENIFALEFAIESIIRLDTDNYEVSMRKESYFEIMAEVELDPRTTTYIEERGNCRKESIPEIIARNFTSAYYQDVFLKELYYSDYCSNGICVPYQLPVNDSELKACDGFETFCEMWMAKSIARKETNKLAMSPCNHVEYDVDYRIKPLELLEKFNKELYEHNYNPEKTTFAIIYNFKQPEYTTSNEEYYLVSVIDLIGLTGGTLGIFIGFSFYGTIANILDIGLSLVSNIKAIRIGKLYASWGTL